MKEATLVADFSWLGAAGCVIALLVWWRLLRFKKHVGNLGNAMVDALKEIERQMGDSRRRIRALEDRCAIQLPPRPAPKPANTSPHYS